MPRVQISDFRHMPWVLTCFIILIDYTANKINLCFINMFNEFSCHIEQLWAGDPQTRHSIDQKLHHEKKVVGIIVPIDTITSQQKGK